MYKYIYEINFNELQKKLIEQKYYFIYNNKNNTNFYFIYLIKNKSGSVQ